MQFLKRDWITTGRRPSGLCGACLLISGKLHGFKLTIDEVASVVRVCNETIKKRIVEFSLTKVAMMSKEEFDQFENAHYYTGSDTPAFTRNREKEEEEELCKGKSRSEINEAWMSLLREPGLLSCLHHIQNQKLGLGLTHTHFYL